MKRSILMAAVIISLTSTYAFSQEPKDAKQHLNIKNMQLDIAERENKIHRQHEMTKLEIEKKRREMNRQENNFNRKNNMPCKGRQKPCGAVGHVIVFAVCALIHILLTVWVYNDIKERKTGSGIWIIVVLLTGLLGIIPYALIRIGDTKQN